jgi:hypothetical protein
MAIEVKGSGQPDGTGIVKATTEKIHVYGGTAVSQAAHIANISTAEGVTYSTILAELNSLGTIVNTLLDDLSDLGITASS